jgi:cytosine/uracil/thiamine/allantoin permease
LQQLADAKLYELLGDKTEADNEKPSKKKKEKPAKVEVSLFTVVLAHMFYFLSHGLLNVCNFTRFIRTKQHQLLLLKSHQKKISIHF